MTGEELFWHPEVLAVIKAIVLSKGIRGDEEIRDLVSDIVEACILRVRATGKPPKDVREAITIARAVGNPKATDAARKQGRRGTTKTSPTEVDEHSKEEGPSLDPVDAQGVFDTLRKALPDDRIEELAAVGSGVKQSALAADSGVSGPAMRKRIETSRDKATKALTAKGYLALGGTFAALLAGVVFVLVVALRHSHNDLPAGGRPPPTAADRAKAAELRRTAAGQCGEERWAECKETLDRAHELDDDDHEPPDVRAMRRQIRDWLIATRAAAEAGSADAASDAGQPAPASTK